MAYRFRGSKRVRKQLDDLPRAVFVRGDAHITDLATTPRAPGAKKLKGRQDTYRVRVGEYRIVYKVDDAAQEVQLLDIGHRKDVYR
ncbi:MAG TPA: type II toxin-antitoxin system RelE/ParE family toxin [Ktedonobacterales bacterium]|jgi:mRNA interferase RelE/StbE